MPWRNSRFTPTRLAGVVALAISIAPAAVAAADSPCRPPDDLEHAVRIDASTGEIHPKDSTYFPLGTQVSLVFHGRNPFRFDYEYLISATDLEAGVVADGLQLLGLSLDPKSAEKSEAPDTAPADATAPGARDLDCNDYTGELSEACTKTAAAAKAVTDALEESRRAAEEYGKGQEKIAAFENEVGGRMSPELCTEVTTAFPGQIQTLGFLADAPKVTGEAFAELEEGERLRIEAKALLDGVVCAGLAPDCSGRTGQDLEDCRANRDATIGECEQAKAAIGRGIEEVEQAHAAASETLGAWKGEIEKLASGYEELLERYRAIQADHEAFVDVHSLGRKRKPTRYAVEIRRTRLDGGKKTEEIEVGEIDVGRSRFSISGGLGVSFATEREFGRQSGLLDDGEVDDVFAVTSRSEEELGLVVQLNARLNSSEAWAFHWSLGTGAGAGEDDLSFFTGPSFAWVDDQLFFTLAYHQRSVRELAGGFAVGDAIPEAVKDPLPLREEDEAALLFTVTYRFK